MHCATSWSNYIPKNLLETNLDVSKMTSSCCKGRKKLSLELQTNKITDSLSVKFEATSIVIDILDWHVQSSVFCSMSNLEWTHYKFRNWKYHSDKNVPFIRDIQIHFMGHYMYIFYNPTMKSQSTELYIHMTRYCQRNCAASRMALNVFQI